MRPSGSARSPSGCSNASPRRGPDNREIRRPTPLSRIAAIANADPAEVIPVIDVFRAPGRSFLMPPHDVALEGDSVIDISHESLIRQWGRLRTWVDQEAESRATYLRLVEAAQLRRAGKAGLSGVAGVRRLMRANGYHHPSGR